MSEAYLNRIATAVPAYDVHRFFLDFAASLLGGDNKRRSLFLRMAERAGIEHRFSCFEPGSDPEGQALDAAGVFRRGAFPGTGKRMAMYEAVAGALAAQAVERLLGADERAAVSHLIVTSCTGFAAPGIDLDVIARAGLPGNVERTIVGFMGCYAAITAMKLARHIVRSDPAARVLIVNVEICTLHLKETADLERLLSFCLWGDGAAAALVSAAPQGFRLDRFAALVAPEARAMMTWTIEDDGFDMVLSGEVPAALHQLLGGPGAALFRQAAGPPPTLWAVHPGGRSVLDAVGRALDLAPEALAASREVLRRHGNMSSATVMFVLAALLGRGSRDAGGMAMAFGPGLTAETMMFTAVG